MRIVAGLAMLLVSAGSATATGGLSCAVDDDEVVMALEGGVSRGMGSALFSFTGRIELRSKDVAEDLGVMEFSREHVAQYWLDGDTLKLRLYREREGDPHGYVEAIVETTMDDDGNDQGEYIVAVYDMKDAVDGEVEPVQSTGAVGCSVE